MLKISRVIVKYAVLRSSHIHTYIHVLYELYVLYIPYVSTCTRNCTVQCTYKIRCVVMAKVLKFLLLVHYVVFGRLQAYFVVFCIYVILYLCIAFCSYNFVFMLRLI